MRKLFATFCTATVLAATLTACATGQKTTSDGALDGEWSIVKINGNEVKTSEEQDKPFLGFRTSEKLVYGSTGCNRLTGSLNADPSTGRIDFGATGSTRMMCRDMTVEQQVLDALKEIKTFEIGKKDTMKLGDGSGKTVMELKKK